MSTAEAIAAAEDGGATDLGFIFFPPSPRYLAPTNAGQLAINVRNPTIKTVAVTVNASDDDFNAIMAHLNPSMLQLHGAETTDRLRELRAKFELPIMKALSVRTGSDLDEVHRFDGVADMILLDAKPPKGSQLPGGNGVSFDWSLIEGLQTETPVLLSGGIGLDNIDAALQLVADPDTSICGIDVSSGVESAPGVKDVAKIAALLAACRPQPVDNV